MRDPIFYPLGSTKACYAACACLTRAGYTFIDHPAPEITHVLLDVPSFQANGLLRCGGSLESILPMLPQQVTIVGGNLSHPALTGYLVLDLLKDEQYLAKNAAITADCAIGIASQKLETALADTPVLILGWGRIGKCLGRKLSGLGAKPWIAARSLRDQAMLAALGYSSLSLEDVAPMLPHCGLIFNTVPSLLLTEDQAALCRNCVKIDLASTPGIQGSDVITARGLPGIHAPETSGKLIADTVIRLIKEETP